MKIKKIKVSEGIYWIEIPEKNFYMLCGCPEDSVKHLMKRGLITEIEKDGVVYESGPNVVLLSDILVQQGQFSNLAEFPVLQMLYRQGMNLPNHPKNTGLKPLLIGSKEQIKSQLEYIYRGNYGLISEDEMVDAGMGSSEAKEMMRLKKRFSYGKIKKTNELIETKIISPFETEIIDEIYIKRLMTNIFQISYKDETVTVNLNLEKNKNYEQIYPLGFQNINREYFAVIHSGEGDGWDINRPSMSSIIMYQGKIFLIDAGPNIIHTLNALGIGINEIEGIFHTHTHDDHFCGMTQLIKSDHKIKYYAVSYVRKSVFKKLSALLSQPEDNLYDYFEICDLNVNEWNNINNLEIKPLFSPHPLETTIFIFRSRYNQGYKYYGHFADIIDLSILKKMITDDCNAPGITKDLFEQVKKNYLQPVDVKKIDIGGGYIHGNAEDFIEDNSSKILLAHTALPLTQKQKEIGSNAPFGMVDILIPTYKDYIRQKAFIYIKNIFNEIDKQNLEILINNPIKTFYPGSIIYKKGKVNNNIYLILTGNVEMLNIKKNIYRILSSGTLIGDINSITNLPVTETYRTLNSVKALEISSSLFLDFVKQYDIITDIYESSDKINFINSTPLFSENISYSIQKIIIKNMKLFSFQKGQELLSSNFNGLCIIVSGKVQLFLQDDLIDTLEKGNYWGELNVLFNKSDIFNIKILEDTFFYCIDIDFLKEIPIVKWKLYETYELRKRLILGEK